MAGRNESEMDFSDYLEGEANKEVRKMAIRLDQRLVLSSAVKDGFLRASFIASVGRPSDFKPNSEDKSGSSTIAAAISVIGSAAKIKYPTIYLQNNQPYAYRIMELGYSLKTPPKTLSREIKRVVNERG